MKKTIEMKSISSVPNTGSIFQTAINWLNARIRTLRRSSLSPAERPPLRQKLLFEAMEPRILLSAAPLPAFVVVQSSGSIHSPGEISQHTITLGAASNVVFDALTDDNRFNWSLDGPDGNVVSNRNFTASDSLDLGASNPVMSLAAGNYTFSVSATGDSTGNYSFEVLDLSKATEIVMGATAADVLTPGNETDVYRFNANAGDHLFLDVTGRSGGNVYWQLLDPSGQQVFGPTAMNSSSQDKDVLSLASTGTYTLLVEGRISATENAYYGIKAEKIEPPSQAPTLTPSTPTVTWIGASGGNWNTAANWSTGAVPLVTDDVYVSVPAGQTVTISSGTVTVNSLFVDGNLTVIGNATLKVNGVSKINGNLIFRVLSLSLSIWNGSVALVCRRIQRSFNRLGLVSAQVTSAAQA